MKTTYITRMPDTAGAFLKASRAIAARGANIARVSYNKAVDVHTLFIEVSAEPEVLEAVGEDLRALGYLAEGSEAAGVVLVALTLPDVPGAVEPVLEVLDRRGVSISYLSSQEAGPGRQCLKVGLLVEDAQGVKGMLDEISRLCEVKILEYGSTEKVLDATVFYIAFANEMRDLLGLDQDQVNDVLVNANRIMQNLDERGEAPIKTFDYIRRFARFIVDHRGAAFDVKASCRFLTGRVTLHVFEPPCGSNTYVLEDGATGDLLFVDCGFSCYEAEMRALFEREFEGFAGRRKRAAFTHGDIDHVGLARLFDELLMVESCRENFALEHAGEPNFRERSPLHAPYSALSRLITAYEPPPLDRVRVLGARSATCRRFLEKVGELTFGDMRFDVYEGAGGHVRGETVYACPEESVAFTGDILVNIKGFSEEQYAFNVLAPYLMTSVNTDSHLATAERLDVERRFAGYLVCPGHGPLMGGRPRWGAPH